METLWLEIELNGLEQHTGTTPMHVRKDAGLAMSIIIQEVNKIAINNLPNVVGSVGQIDVFPNSRNVIPGKTIFTVDFRSHLNKKLNNMEKELNLIVEKICKKMQIEFSIKQLSPIIHGPFNTLSIILELSPNITSGPKDN